MRLQGVEEAEGIRTEREAAQGATGVQSQLQNVRALGQTEGTVTLGSRADRQASVGVPGDLFIEDETGWIYVYGTAWEYKAGVYVGTHAQLTALVLDSTDEGALFLVKDAGVNHGLWVVEGGAFVREILPASPDVQTGYKVSGSQVMGARKTGWATATGTATRSAFDTSTVTLPELAERVKALIDDFHQTTGHGALGT